MGVGRLLATRNGIGLVIVGPVIKAGGEAGAACLAASPNGVVIQGSRPQVRVVKVVRLVVGGELALRPRGLGRRMKKGVLIEDKPTGQEPARKNSETRKEERKEKLTTGGGLAQEYGSLPYCHSSVSLQLVMWFTR